MKPDITKRLSHYDVAMIGNLFPLTEDMVHDIMLDKGDIDEVPIIKDVYSMCHELPKSKSMKAAERRKKTFHKHEQREKQYKSLGYHVERLSASERGKLRDGVGAFPEGQHMNSMYNRNSCEGGMRGNRKEDKHFSVKKAIEQAEHEKQVAYESALMEHELSDLYNCIGSCVVDAAMYKDMLDDVLVEIEEAMSNLSNLKHRKEYYMNAIESNRASEERLLKMAKKLEKELEDLRKIY